MEKSCIDKHTVRFIFTRVKLVRLVFLVCAIVASPFVGYAQTVYTVDGIDSFVVSHRNVAILPCVYLFDKSKLPEGINVDFLKKMEQDEGYRVQRDIYERILVKKPKYSVEVQDIHETNARLADAGIDYYALETVSYRELSGVLGVDAVLCGRVENDFDQKSGYTYTRPGFHGGGIATTMVGTKMTVNIDLYDTREGKLLWKMKATKFKSNSPKMTVVDNSMIDKVLTKLPYKKKYSATLSRTPSGSDP